MSDEIILYTSPEGNKRVAVYYQGETVWLTQKQLADLFDVDVRTISDHLQTIFQTGELSQESVIRKIRITASDGKAYLTNLYSLDAIIAVGYRVNSVQATRFRAIVISGLLPQVGEAPIPQLADRIGKPL